MSRFQTPLVRNSLDKQLIQRVPGDAPGHRQRAGAGHGRLHPGGRDPGSGRVAHLDRDHGRAGADRSNGATVIETRFSIPRLQGRVLELAGTTTWVGTREAIATNAVIHNLKSGLFQLGGEGFLDSASSRFLNEGALVVMADAPLTRLGTSLDNQGSVAVGRGTLRLDNGGTHTGRMAVAAPGLLEFGGGTHVLGPASEIAGDGAIRFRGNSFGEGTFRLEGDYPFTGTTVVSGGTFELRTDLQLARFTQTGGRLTGPGNLTVTQNLTWEGGTMTGAGRTRAEGTSAIRWTDSIYDLFLDRIFENAGTVIWAGAGDLFARNNAYFDNLPGAIFDIRTAARFARVGPAAAFVNQGTLRKSLTNRTPFQVPITNAGALEVLAGTLPSTPAP